jgi:hypothetical protein
MRMRVKAEVTCTYRFGISKLRFGSNFSFPCRMIELPSTVPTAMIAFPITTIGVDFFMRFWTRTVKDRYFPLVCPGIMAITYSMGKVSKFESKESTPPGILARLLIYIRNTESEHQSLTRNRLSQQWTPMPPCRLSDLEQGWAFRDIECQEGPYGS